MGRDERAERAAADGAKFQSTRPHGARLFEPVEAFLGLGVSIHAPAWGATASLLPITLLRFVSIHAPAWGATYPILSVAATGLVSIHAPAWGATSCQIRLPCTSRRFNPRARMGRDDIRHNVVCAGYNVSIHAPAWGATFCESSLNSLSVMFQSTRPHGARHTPSLNSLSPVMFQSTRPHGARRIRPSN